MSFVYHNGLVRPADSALFTVANPSFKWGEGVFETIRVQDGDICLAAYHFERLLGGLHLLGIKYSADFIARTTAQVLELCKKNNCADSARVRLTAFRGEDGFVETVIEAVPLDAHSTDWNKEGWKVGIYKEAVIPTDRFANIKKVSYLPYKMATHYATQNSLDECLLLNHQERLCDGGKTNFFLVKDGAVYTPALLEGCIAGVMRRHVIATLSAAGVTLIETSVTLDMLLNADEMFLTNAITGIKWVAYFQDKKYSDQFTRQIHNFLFSNVK